ncbi:MAG: cytochrome c3 family protein [Planctomycetota bacterium]|nr:cytochrome c3 family protein [Planctomycetota bacterium]MDP6940799.1 cytochrome c3 family protein [Planctomycetota bacterium]
MKQIRTLLLAALVATVPFLGAGCLGGSSSSVDYGVLNGSVSGAGGEAISGATVYLVPTTSIDLTEMTSAGMRAGTTVDFDEPLEDAVRLGGSSFTSAVTDSLGDFEIDGVPDGDFFVYVDPGTGYLPGGSWCRDSVAASGLRGQDIDLEVTGVPSSSATHVGGSTCLTCHPDHVGSTKLAHSLGFSVVGEFGQLQDGSYHPEFWDGLVYFLAADVYSDGTPVYYYDYDGGRGMDKFKTSMTDPTLDGGTVHAKVWLWQDNLTDEYKLTIENIGNPADPMSPSTHVAKLTYGGAVNKQRFMIEWEDAGLNGLYPFFQFQHAGDEAKYARDRKQFRDYHMDYYWDVNGTDADASDDLIKVPDVSKNMSKNCLACHATGWESYTDAVTGEILCDSVEDVGGEFNLDPDEDSTLNILNTSCESCHGPGSEHVAVNIPGSNFEGGKHIVLPEYLTPAREIQICNRCHDRLEGAGGVQGGFPQHVDTGEFPLPGISRAEYLASYVKISHPKTSKMWADDIHPKSHHQQGPDFMKSDHYRNVDKLMTCSDCHDLHGDTNFARALVGDPTDGESSLCMDCHGADIVDVPTHTALVLGAEGAHGSSQASCVDCHMVKTAKTGAGDYGALLGAPDGTSGDNDLVYFQNDITSHVFDVPRKDNVGVDGVTPSSAMPVPYTQACGTCHDVSTLQF